MARRRHTRYLAALALGAAAATLGGCANAFAIAQGVAGMVPYLAANIEETGSHTVFAEYEGLQGHEFAVLVSADRVIESNHPRAVPVLSNAVARRLTAEEVGATGFVPGPKVLQFQYTNPDWTAWTFEELAEEFTVDRLVIVEIYEYRLHEPGNRYSWDGRVGVRVGVVEADEATPETFAFERDMRVRYPDSAHAEQELSAQHVEAVLQRRIVDRVSWLFYDHEEPNNMKY